jgi:hypothetical protein
MGKTNTASNAKLQYEAGQEYNAMAAMADAGDHLTFSLAGASLGPAERIRACRASRWSCHRRRGHSGDSNDTVAVAALTCYLAGELKTVSADSDVAVTRPTSTHKISSITINSSGAIAVVSGTDGTSFSSTHGEAGGPPLIPAGSIEIAQVKMSSATPALITASEIFQIIGFTCERWDYPVWSENPFSGEITFASALPAIHEGTSATTKGVYAQVYEPIFADLEPVSDFVPPENSHSVSSTQVYGGTVGASSTSLGQGSFKAFLKDGVSESFIGLKDEVLFSSFSRPQQSALPHLQRQTRHREIFPGGRQHLRCLHHFRAEAAKEASV